MPNIERRDPKGITRWAASFTPRHAAALGDQRRYGRVVPPRSRGGRQYVHATTDKDTRGRPLWSYCLGKLRNRTLTVADLEEINAGFSKTRVVDLVGKMAADSPRLARVTRPSSTSLRSKPS